VDRRLAWAFALLLLAGPAFAETVVLDAVLRGTAFTVAPDASYAIPGTGGFDANVFVFDLSSVADPIVSAELVVENPAGGFASPQRRETFTVFAVTDTETYRDAGEGAPLGAIEVDEDSPTTLEIPLAAPMLRVLERTDGVVVIGGRLTTLKKFDGSEQLFEGTGPGSGVPAPQLVLVTDPGGTPAAAATLHVAADGDDEDGDGSAGAPFASIGFALDLAAPGDVVQVAPGRYEERVLLKADVEVRANAATDTQIDGGVECADGALLDGFRVSGSVFCGHATELSHNTLESDPIELRGSGVWLHHNEIHGAVVVAPVGATVEDNEIVSSIAIFAAGVPGDEAGAALIQRNRVRGALASDTLSPLLCGMLGLQPLHLTLASNVFLPPAGAGSGGVDLRGCVTGDVLHNTFHESAGVRVESSAVVASNLLVNGTAGIEVEAGADVEIRHNDVFGNRSGVMGPSTNYVGIASQTGSNGNISADPDFVDAFFEDFRVRPDSPPVDAGSDDEDDVEGNEDFDGDPRVVDGDDDDEDVVDMGAQEFQPGEELPLPELPIEVDVLPGKSPNELRFPKVAKGSGKLAVAILSDDELDAPADVDVATLILEREPALRCNTKDVDHDDRRDLVCSFPLRGISVETWPIFVPPACVRGRTHGGRKLLGCDEVEVVP